MEIYWLNPRSSFDMENKSDNQLDFPLTAKVFTLRSFPNTIGVTLNNASINKKLCSYGGLNSNIGQGPIFEI